MNEARSRRPKLDDVQHDELLDAETKLKSTQNHKIKTSFRLPVLTMLCANRFKNLIIYGKTKADLSNLIVGWVSVV